MALMQTRMNCQGRAANDFSRKRNELDRKMHMLCIHATIDNEHHINDFMFADSLLPLWYVMPMNQNTRHESLPRFRANVCSFLRSYTSPSTFMEKSAFGIHYKPGAPMHVANGLYHHRSRQ